MCLGRASPVGFGGVGVVMHGTGERGGVRDYGVGLSFRVDATLLFKCYCCTTAAACLLVQGCAVGLKRAASSLGVAVDDGGHPGNLHRVLPQYRLLHRSAMPYRNEALVLRQQSALCRV